MKNLSAGRLAYLTGEGLPEARCWRVERRDGEVFTFTSLDIDVTYNGEVYAAATGFTPSAVSGSAGLAVDNMEVSGILDSAAITEDDLMAGRWDDAEVTIFDLNYQDISQGIEVIATGRTGNVNTGRLTFNVEVRGITQRLAQQIGRMVKPGCDADLGDARCGVNLASYTVTGGVTGGITGKHLFSDASRSEATGYFNGGVITWLTGANVGLQMEIKTQTLTFFELWLPMFYTVAIGDTYSLTSGCNKMHQVDLVTGVVTGDCHNRYANVINFRGFPFVPGADAVMSGT